jgi:RNA polymerase sigma-70 factor (ECF subfamily)
VISADSDADLLTRWSAGDRAAGNSLVERHFSAIYRFVRAKIDDGIDDLVQQIFLALVEHAGNVRNAESFKAFLFGIARRQMLLYWRDRKAADKVFAEGVTSVRSLAPASDTSPSKVVARLGERERVLAAMRGLPLDFQIVVELHYWEEMGVREIAAVVEIPDGTVKSRLSRSRAQLEETLRSSGAELDTHVRALVPALRKD